MGKKTILSLLVLLLVVIAIVAAIVLIRNTIKGNEIVGISVSKAPDKHTYILNQSEPDYSGIWLQVMKANGDFEIVKDTSLMTFSGFDTSNVTDKMIVGVNYEGFVATFTLKVEEAPKPARRLVGIELEIPEDEALFKKHYTKDESLDATITNGIVVRKYNNGDEVRVNLAVKDITGFKAAKESGPREEPYDLTVTYTDPTTNITKTATFPIWITE